jgi:hypothetical protein
LDTRDAEAGHQELQSILNGKGPGNAGPRPALTLDEVLVLPRDLNAAIRKLLAEFSPAELRILAEDLHKAVDFIERLGLPRTRPGSREEKPTPSARTVSEVRPNPTRRLNNVQRRRIVTLSGEGKMPQEIAEMVGCSTSTVLDVIKKQKIASGQSTRTQESDPS